jgi:hypothetical protein
MNNLVRLNRFVAAASVTAFMRPMRLYARPALNLFLAAASAAAIVEIASLVPAAGQRPAATAPAEPGKPAALIAGYRRWTKVNPTPRRMMPASAEQCAPAFASQQPSPHFSKYITVYVNGRGKAAMMGQKSPQFPVGTVIVKEKLSRPDSKSPELMTVMVKRDHGFDQDSGDWEYLVFDGMGKRAASGVEVNRCRSCHNEHPAIDADHVYRAYYLPSRR